MGGFGIHMYENNGWKKLKKRQRTNTLEKL